MKMYFELLILYIKNILSLFYPLRALILKNEEKDKILQ